MTPTPHQEQHCLRQIKRLTQILIASGTLNVLLVVFVCYGFFGNGVLVVRETLQQRLRPAPAVVTGERNMGQVLRSYQQLSRDQLIAKLEDITGVQDGYSERDLALAYLVWKHHFNIEQALADSPPPRQQTLPIRSGDQVTQLTLFRGLTPQQYDALVQFAKMERWPLTTEGLFYALQKEPLALDGSAAEAFCLTPEFIMLQRACARANMDRNKADLLAVVRDCDWHTLKTIIAQLQAAPEESSTVLATWLGTSARETAVVASAPPVKSVPTIPVLPISSVPAPAHRTGARVEAPHRKVHVVKTGESLWKIAKSYNVDIVKLKTLNHLHSDNLRPGAKLCIP